MPFSPSLQPAIQLQAIGLVKNQRLQPIDDQWGQEISVIELDTARFKPDSLKGLESFSHLYVLFYMHLVQSPEIVTGARHPRGQKNWPEVGIFAQRAKGRPNQLGLSVCELVGVKDTSITVRGLDAIHETPVLDIKPYFQEFAPRTPVKQPIWVHELMKNYY